MGTASWSGLSRPSTSSLVGSGVQDVDARHKGEHDVEPQFIRFHFTERQINPPMTQPAVVSVLPESVIVPE